MKRVNQFLPITLLLVISVTILYFFFILFNLNIDSNFFVSLVTLIVGSIVIYLYIAQKNDERKDAANVILAEIRHAEHLIDQFKKSGVSNDVFYQILPSNNWNKSNYLFINDLDADEIDLISSFYNQCFVLDRAIDQINISHELKNKSIAIHHVLALIAKESAGNDGIFNQAKKSFIEIMSKDGFAFNPKAPLDSIAKALNNVRFVTTSSVGLKLKKIAGLN